MTEFFQLVVVGLSTGSAFALVGMSLVLVYRTTGIVNFAQGVFAVTGGLFTFQLSDDLPTEVVVVGSKGLTASSIQVPGTTTLALLRYSRVPVLVVTGTHPEPAPRPTPRDSASAKAERA